MEYLFILGRDPGLSLAEIASYLQSQKMSFRLKDHNDKIAILEMQEFNPVKMINRLGGTVKIAEFTKDYSYYGNKNKITYAVGTIACDADDFIEELRKMFRREKLKATLRMPKPGEEQLMPSKAASLDLEFIVYKNDIYRVVAVSRPKEFKARDETRPAFEPLSVISLRLAKIMINLSQAAREVLDPFCGKGTILQEALMMGLNAVGVDKDVNDADKNLNWLGDKFKGKWRLIQGDSTEISYLINEVEAVATEPYMGPYWKNIPAKEEAERTAKMLSKMYLSFLKEAKKILKGKIAIIIPRFKSTGGRVEMDVDKIIKEAGFKIYQPIKAVSMPIPYYESQNKLERFIYVLETA